MILRPEFSLGSVRQIFQKEKQKEELRQVFSRKDLLGMRNCVETAFIIGLSKNKNESLGGKPWITILTICFMKCRYLTIEWMVLI